MIELLVFATIYFGVITLLSMTLVPNATYGQGEVKFERL